MKFLWILLVLCACNSSENDQHSTLKISFPKNPSSLDPRKSSDFLSSSLICLLYEGLTRCKAGVEIEPGVAEKIDISEDRKIYLFHLRESHWSNGQKVTAKDFENSWKQILSPGFPAPCAYLLYPIKNGERYSRGLCHENDVGIFAIDEDTLKVELESPTDHFLSLTAFPLLLPAPPSPGVYNGPFIIEKMNIGSEIYLKKNENFWNEREILLKHIHISIVPDERTSLFLFEKGEIDLLGGPLTPVSQEALTHHKRIQQVPMDASTFCVMNTNTFPFSNPFIRKAFCLSVQNHPILSKELIEMGQLPSSSILPPTLSLVSHSPKKENVRDLLDKGLNKSEKKSLETLTLLYKGTPIEKKIALTLQKIWKEELGITVQLVQLDPTSLTQKLYAKNFTLAISSWIAQFHDPINLLERFLDENAPKNYSSWSDTNFKTLLELAKKSPENREIYLKKAEEIIEEDHPIIPLYHWNFPILLNSEIETLPTNISGGILFEKVVKSPPRSSFLHH